MRQMKKWGRFLVLGITVLSVTASSCAFPFFWKKDKSDEQAVRREDLPTGDATYLDTLNSGNEVALAESEFESAGIIPPVADESAAGAGTATDGFRIQCFASSSIDAVREKKKHVEDKTGLVAYIAFAEPYYKLHLGNFANREQAEAGLQRVKRAGFADAWIVRSRVEASN
jgi:hypothetical protein